jgi:hypothetical protein
MSESGRMRDLYVGIKFKDEASAEVARVKHSMDAAKEAGRELMALAGVGFGLEKMKDIAVESLKLAANLESQQLKLKQLSGEDFPEIESAIKRAKAESGGMIDDSGLIEAANNALKFSSSMGFVKNNLSEVQKLATMSGGDMSSMMEKMAALIEGFGGPRVLKGIPVLRKYKDEFKTLAAIQGEAGKIAREQWLNSILAKESVAIGEKYNEVLKTNAARLQKLKVIWEETKEAFGTSLFKEYGSIFDTFDRIRGHVLAFMEDYKGFSEGAIAVYDVLTTILSPLKGVLKLFDAVLIVIEDVMAYTRGWGSVTGDNIVKIKTLLSSVGAFWRELVTSMKNAISDFFSYIVDIFTAIPAKIIDSIISIPSRIRESVPDIKAAAMSVMDSIKENVGIGIEHRAGGGNTNAGQSYLVGEHGPEIFRSSTPGTIVPNSQIGGSITISSIVGNMVFNVSGGEEAAEKVRSAVLSVLDEIGKSDLRAALGMSLS